MEKLNCGSVSMEALATPLKSCEEGMTLHSCPELDRENTETFYTYVISTRHSRKKVWP